MFDFAKKALKEQRNHVPNALWHFLYSISKQIFVFGTFILGLLLLSPYDFGLYNYLMAVFLLFVVFGDFGISAATSKYIAELRALGHEKERSVLFNAFIIAIVTIGLVGIVAYLLTPDVLGEKKNYMIILFPALFFLPLAYLYAGVYRGIGRFKTAAVISLAVSVISLFAAYILMIRYGVRGALWANDFFAFFLFIALAIGYREWSFKLDRTLIKNIGSYSLLLGASSLSFYLYSRVDVLMLGYWGYITQIGFYEFIDKIFLALVAPFSLAAQVIAPSVAADFVQKKVRAVLDKFLQIMFLSFGAGIVLTALVFWVTPILASHLSGQYPYPLFLSVMYIMLITLPGQAIASIAAAAFSLATGHARLNILILLLFWLINIPLTYFFIKYFEFMGAVYATTIITVFTDIAFVGVYYLVLRKKAKEINQFQ